MLASGIVVEYNPFHNGHRYHIAMTRQLTNCEVLVAVMSGNFVQRGEPAICDKWVRTRAALENGVDLVIELPFVYSNQAAGQFASGAVRLLALAGVKSIVFGSESNNLDELKTIADMSINVNNLRESLKTGIGFPKAYGLMAGEYYPNDILGIAYLKALKNTSITPFALQRTTHYNDMGLDQPYASAKAIRQALRERKNISAHTPLIIDPAKARFLADDYPYIRTLLLTLPKSYLNHLFLFSEGIENHLIRQAQLSADFATFINRATTRRYSRARIQRTLITLLCQLSKAEVADLPPLDTLRVLGFNDTGRAYLRELADRDVRIAARFNQVPLPYRRLELRAAAVYDMFDAAQPTVKREIKGPVII